MGISLESAKKIIDNIEEIEKTKTDILSVLPNVYVGLESNEVTNFLLRLSINNNHFYSFIKERLLENKLFEPFEISVESSGIKLIHKNAHSSIYSSTKTALKISFEAKTYDSSYLEGHKKYYSKSEVIKEVHSEGSYHLKVMDSVVKFIEKPSFGARCNIFKMSLDTEKKSLRNHVVSLTNMFAPYKVLKKVYDTHMERESYTQGVKERELERKRDYNTWVENEFPSIVMDTEKLIGYLQGIGYTYRKDI